MRFITCGVSQNRLFDDLDIFVAYWFMLSSWVLCIGVVHASSPFKFFILFFVGPSVTFSLSWKLRWINIAISFKQWNSNTINVRYSIEDLWTLNKHKFCQLKSPHDSMPLPTARNDPANQDESFFWKLYGENTERRSNAENKN